MSGKSQRVLSKVELEGHILTMGYSTAMGYRKFTRFFSFRPIREKQGLPKMSNHWLNPVISLSHIIHILLTYNVLLNISSSTFESWIFRLQAYEETTENWLLEIKSYITVRNACILSAQLQTGFIMINTTNSICWLSSKLIYVHANL